MCKIASLNVNGIKGHHDEMLSMLAHTVSSIFAVNKTKVDASIPDRILDIDCS